MNEVIKKVKSNEILTEEEVFNFLSYICNVIRKDTNIYDPMSPDCKVCFDTFLKFGHIMLLKFGCDVSALNIKEEFEIPLTHYANIISFNVNGEKKEYLVDMTFSQFFGENIILDDGKVVSNEVFKSVEQENWVQNLRKNGFIQLNDDIYNRYIQLFIEICNIKKTI